jgi:hypothetical protein
LKLIELMQENGARKLALFSCAVAGAHQGLIARCGSGFSGERGVWVEDFEYVKIA